MKPGDTWTPPDLLAGVLYLRYNANKIGHFGPFYLGLGIEWVPRIFYAWPSIHTQVACPKNLFQRLQKVESIVRVRVVDHLKWEVVLTEVPK